MANSRQLLSDSHTTATKDLQLQQNKAAQGEPEHCTTHEQAMHLLTAFPDRRQKAEGRRHRQKADGSG